MPVQAAMAKAIVASGTGTPIYFIQTARNSSVHAMRNEVQDLARSSGPVVARFIYDAPLPDDLQAGRCDAVGLVTKDLLSELTPTTNAEYYFCGPKPFMSSIDSMLNDLGVEASRRHCEFFGPKQSLAAV